MTDRELMQQALDALESVFEGDDKGAEYWTVTGGTYEAVECMNAMRALRARLAQPEPAECDGGQCGIGGYCKECPKTQLEQEPVAYVKTVIEALYENSDPVSVEAAELLEQITTLPQREWKGLTDDEYEAMAEKYVTNCYFDTLTYARAIEAKLKEKNT